MPNFRPGRRDETFEDRCLKDVFSCVCRKLGDWLHVDNCRGCYVWHRDLDKRDDLGDIRITQYEMAIYWPACEKRNVVCGSEVIRKGKRYTVKYGFPIDQGNGWMCAELEYCGVC